MRKINKFNFNKKIALSSISALAIATGTAVVALTSSNETIANLSKEESNLRSISNNHADKENLVNPNELFFMNPILNTQTTPIKDASGQIIQENVNRWKQFSQNVAAIPFPSETTGIVRSTYEELKNLGKSVEASLTLNEQLKTAKQEWEDKINSITDPILSAVLQAQKDEIWANSLKPAILEKNPGAFEDLDSIPSINTIQDSLLILSGIVDSGGVKIASISNYANGFNRVNLSGNGTPEAMTIGDVAGAGYVQLVKIAEIDPAQQGNYVIDFEYAKGAQQGKGAKIVIKNDNNQLTDASNDISGLSNSLDIFGRWNEESAQIGSEQFPSAINNFVFQIVNNKLEVLVRVNEQFNIKNITFATEIEGVEGKLLQPSTFGILDVQASATQTFVSSIKQDPADKKLIENINDKTKVIDEVQFFSNVLIAKPEQSADILNTRKLEFYQGPNSDVTLGINVASQPDDQNAESFEYSPVYVYENGVSTGKIENVVLKTTGTAPSQINGAKAATYNLYKGYIEKLPKAINDSNFEAASTITLTSSVDTTTKLTKQSLLYSDRFYALGDMSVDNTGTTISDLKVKILDLTQKIFFEKPKAWQDASNQQSDTSTLKAQKTVNERDVVIELLGALYNEFSQPNSGIVSDLRFNLNSITLWTASGSNGSYTNIKAEKKDITSGSANSIYNELNKNWNLASQIMSQLFSIESTANKYDGSSIQKAKEVVNNILAAPNEFNSNPAIIDTLINDSIKVIKESNNGAIPEGLQLSSLNKDTIKVMSDSLVKMIEMQFGAIEGEIQSLITNSIFNFIKTEVDKTTTSSYKKIKPASEIIEIVKSNEVPNLFRYKSKAWESLATNEEITLKDALSPLFDLLYLNNGNGNLLGESIFRSLDDQSIFKGMSAQTLVNLESLDNNGKKSVVTIYNTLITRLGSEANDLQKSVNKMLREGKPLNIQFSITNALKDVINNIVNGKRNAKVEDTSAPDVNSNYLDDIISGTNIIIALNWKLQNLVPAPQSTSMSSILINEVRAQLDVANAIQYILSSNSQYNSFELSDWSNVINGNINYSGFTEALSGRKPIADFDKVVNGLIDDNNILAKRVDIQPTSSSIVQIGKILEQVWWIVVALIGVGVLTSSIVGLATKERQVKLSSRPVVKWLLVSGIVLGLAVAALAILIGIM